MTVVIFLVQIYAFIKQLQIIFFQYRNSFDS